MILTTITTVWRREEMLRLWLANLRYATRPDIFHLVYFIGELPPAWWAEEAKGINIKVMLRFEPPGGSIGYYHNLGAEAAPSEWIMKLDVDAFPNQYYFRSLLPILDSAGPREWFNGGMFYVSKFYSVCLLDSPLIGRAYEQVMGNRRTYAAMPYLGPAATNFICRRKDYLALGGCSPGFHGYGWEDYQQIYMLEKYQRGEDPLPGALTLANVTRRCRDEISRPKAQLLLDRDPWLCLLHHWHPAAKGTSMDQNRKVLYDYILTSKGNHEPIQR